MEGPKGVGMIRALGLYLEDRTVNEGNFSPGASQVESVNYPLASPSLHAVKKADQMLE